MIIFIQTLAQMSPLDSRTGSSSYITEMSDISNTPSVEISDLG